ncbi:MAG TPA: AI-2E family transporter [Polyangiaceae bacterium]|nr:AI-2E family transporter [Polyangiaceae bacterium]
MSEPPHRSTTLRWILIALTAATLYVCWPLWPALVMASWTAGLASTKLSPLGQTLKNRRRVAAAFSLVLFIGLALPLAGVMLGVTSGVNELAQLLSRQPSVKVALESLASGPDAPGPRLPADLGGALELVERHGLQVMHVLGDVAGAAATGLLALCTYFGGTYVFLLHGRELWAWMQRNSPLESLQLARLAAAFHETGHGLLVGVGLTSATQGAVATLVFLALGVPRWWVLGPLTGLASIIPVFGSALIWAPIAAGLFLSGHTIKAVVLLVVGTAVISTADNLLQPFFARLGSLRMPTYLLFVTLFGGLIAFGAWGAILGPLIVRLWLEALTLQREASSSDGLDPPDANEA